MLKSKIVLQSSNGQREFFKTKYMNEHTSQSHAAVNAKTSIESVKFGNVNIMPKTEETFTKE